MEARQPRSCAAADRNKGNGGRSNTVAPEPPAPAGGDTRTDITGLAINDSGEHAMLRMTVAGVLVSGRTLTAVVPWVSLGGREDASVSAFADWSSGVGRLSADGVPRTDMSVGGPPDRRTCE